MKKITKYLRHPSFIFLFLDKKRILTLKDDTFVKLKYKEMMNRTLNLKEPKTFNEKIQWMKLYNKNPNYTKMVDKFEVKNYVSNIIGDKYIIPTIGIYNNFDDINFEELPEKFVLKCTHDSGSTIICKNKNKFNIDEANKKIIKSMKTNFYYMGREWAYKDVKPRIIIEAYMQEEGKNELTDYKFMCFNGKVECSFVCLNRTSEDGLNVDFYDKNWKKMPFERHYKNSNIILDKPSNYDLMIELAEKLSKDIPFVRVDFYDIDGKIYFGELTFYPGCGFEEFNPEEWDKKLGDLIKLPKKEEKNEK